MSASGICRFCGRNAEDLDRDDLAFVTARADRCNATRCIIAWQQEYDREIFAEKQRKKAMRELRDRTRGHKSGHRRRRFAA